MDEMPMFRPVSLEHSGLKLWIFSREVVGFRETARVRGRVTATAPSSSFPLLCGCVREEGRKRRPTLSSPPAGRPASLRCKVEAAPHRRSRYRP